MPQLWCPKCKRNQDTIRVKREGDNVTFQCVVCGTYITVYSPVVKRSGKHTGRPYRC
jgi:Zn ribbon nucleic-acid-binding protein